MEVGGEMIYSLPTMYLTKKSTEQKEIAVEPTSTYDEQILSKVFNVYYRPAECEFDTKYEEELELILSDLKKYHGVGVEIFGYASSECDEELNKKLSNERAISVVDYLNHRGIVRRKIIAKRFGATDKESVGKQESRRVKLQIVDLNNI